MTNLFLNVYFEHNEARRKELEISYQKNFLARFDHIFLLCEKKDEKYSAELGERFSCGDTILHIHPVDSRPPIQSYINIANELVEDNPISKFLSVIMNSDLSIDKENLDKLKSLPWEQKLFVSLSRWDITENGSAVLLNRQDSQDCWAFYGYCNIENFPCPCGSVGVDNRLAYEARKAGYKLINPSKDIQVQHLHNVKRNNYRVDSDPNGAILANMICPEPYYFKAPHFINEI